MSNVAVEGKMTVKSNYVERVLEVVKRRNAGQPEFLQAVTEVLESLAPVVEKHKKYEDAAILERVVEPERQVDQPPCAKPQRQDA